VPVNAENTFLLFKERRPFKLKKEYPSEQWQIISFQLIPLKTPVSFRWTVPLKGIVSNSNKQHTDLNNFLILFACGKNLVLYVLNNSFAV
jgi:hypothetical protein